jgi:hypothetical protein
MFQQVVRRAFQRACCGNDIPILEWLINVFRITKNDIENTNGIHWALSSHCDVHIWLYQEYQITPPLRSALSHAINDNDIQGLQWIQNTFNI